MKCRQSEELFSDYHAGSLATPLRRDIEEHLGSCTDCRALLVDFRAVTDTDGLWGQLAVHLAGRGAPDLVMARRRLAGS